MNAKVLLRGLGLDYYDPELICRKTHGQQFDDFVWMQFSDEPQVRYEDIRGEFTLGITPVVLYLVNLLRRKRAVKVLTRGVECEAELLLYKKKCVKSILRFIRAEYIAFYGYCVDGYDCVFVKKWRNGLLIFQYIFWMADVIRKSMTLIFRF